jgi:Gly-Xaa carboxypeptidase
LAFGRDEEISGPRGANSIGKYLEQEYGRNGISMIVDEGRMSLEMVYGKGFALPGIAEKGYIVSLYFLCIHNFRSDFIY